MSEDAKKTILARRAKFVAAAMASVGLASAEACHPKDADSPNEINVDDAGQPPPNVCLSVSLQRDEDASAPPPQPCLSPVVPQPPDDDAGAFAQPPPQVCLSPMPPPRDAGAGTPKTQPTATPMPCLSVSPKQAPKK